PDRRAAPARRGRVPLLLLGAAPLRRHGHRRRRPDRQLRRPLLRPGPQPRRRQRLTDPCRRRRDRRARRGSQHLAAPPPRPLRQARAPMSRLALIGLALALAAAGCSGGNNAAPPQPPSAARSTTSGGVPGPRQLTDLRDIGQLRSLFNTRSGEPRLILLVSPT